MLDILGFEKRKMKGQNGEIYSISTPKQRERTCWIQSLARERVGEIPLQHNQGVSKFADRWN